MNKVVDKLKNIEEKYRLRLVSKYIVELFFLCFSFFSITIIFSLLLNNKLVFTNTSTLFSFLFSIFIGGIIFMLPIKIKKITYSILYLTFVIIFLVQYFYYSILSTFFVVSDLGNTAFGLSYISFIKNHISFNLIISIIFFIILFIIAYKNIYEKEVLIKLFKKKIFKIVTITAIIIIFITARIITINLLNDDEVDTFYDVSSEIDAYNDFRNKNAVMALTNLYEFTIKDILVYLDNTIFLDLEGYHKEIDEYFSDKKDITSNDYTGLFEGKNLIYVLMESIDTWMVNSDNTPTITRMQEEGINLTNYYAPAFGSGRTFNTEYTANTGLYIPVSGYNIYNSEDNSMPNSLPNLFKEEEYYTTSIHVTSGSFYNRYDMHEAFGYENSYFLENAGYDIYKYRDDSELIKNDFTYKAIVPNEDKFMTFVISYSGHGPYVGDNDRCGSAGISDELECAYYNASQTDEFFELLLDKLEEDKILDDTVIIAFTDHYAYGYSDIEELKSMKGSTDNYDIEKVPAFIWSSDIESVTLDSYVDTSDLVPTISNLFNLGYDKYDYLGTDIFSEHHNNYVYFSDLGYVGVEISKKEIDNMIDINNKIIISNYYSK